MEVIETISKIRKIAKDVKNEDATKQHLILPLLQSLGWDIFNPLEVVPEPNIGEGRADYALKINGEIIALIEAKSKTTSIVSSFGLNMSHARQLIGYCCEAGVELGILTNGLQWVVFKTFEPKKPISERVLLSVDLRSEDIEKTAEKIKWLSKSKILQLLNLPTKRVHIKSTATFNFPFQSKNKDYVDIKVYQTKEQQKTMSELLNRDTREVKELIGKEISLNLITKSSGRGYSGSALGLPLRISVDRNSLLLTSYRGEKELEKALSRKFSRLLSLLIEADRNFKFEEIRGEVTKRFMWIAAINFKNNVKLKVVEDINGNIEVFQSIANAGSYGAEQRYKKSLPIPRVDSNIVTLKIRIL